jgi:hypothetical protein
MSLFSKIATQKLQILYFSTMTSSKNNQVVPVTVEGDEAEESYNDDPLDWKSNEKETRPVSPKVDSVIKSFNEELDNLTKSLDQVLLASIPNPSNRSSSTREYLFSTAHKSPLLKLKDPPPSTAKVSPMRNYGLDSTPARRSNNSNINSNGNSNGRFSSYSTPTEPPPVPVETPAFNLFATATPNRRGREERDRVLPVREKETQRRKRDYVGPGTDWEDALEKMRWTMAEQERRILQLEHENEALRQKVKSNQKPLRSPFREEPQPSSERPYNYNQGGPPPTPTSQLRPSYREEPHGRFPTSASRPTSFLSSTRGHIRSPPRRIHTNETGSEEAFSPGTSFVAELARLLKMEKGHHAPLSVILDKHWERLRHNFDDEDL